MEATGVETIDENVVGPVRVRPIDGRYLVTNAFGDWTWLEADELKAFLEGRSADLELSAQDLKALDAIDKTQLVETAVAVRSSLLQRTHRGSGGI